MPLTLRRSASLPLLLSALALTGIVPRAGASLAAITPAFSCTWGSGGSGPGQFNLPFGAAVDPQGNVYVIERGGNRVQKFDFHGKFLAQWGSTGSGTGQFNAPSFIATDATGNVYVTDSGNNRVEKFTSAGTFVLQWGTAGSGNGQFNNPYAIATDAAGNVYVTEWNGNRVQKFTGAGVYVTKWGSTGSGLGQFQNPSGIAADPFGNVFVGDQNNRIQKFTNTGTYESQWGSTGSGNGQLSNSNGIGCDALGNVYVTEYNNNRVQKFANDGTYLTQWGVPGGGNGQFNRPIDIAIDAAGNGYVTDMNNTRIQKFSGAGVPPAPPSPGVPYVKVATMGAFGTGAGQFTFPVGLAVNPFGEVYGVDPANERVQWFNSAGNDLGSWGSSGSGPGQFSNPVGAATDAAGNVYVVDKNLNRVQKFSRSGTYLLTWGSTGTANGQFGHPDAIATDAAGNVYVADYDNKRVQKFDPTGTWLAQFGAAGSNPGQLQGPVAVTVDAAGNVFVGDLLQRIEKYSSSGTYLTQWGQPGGSPGNFGPIEGMCVDPAGFLYVDDLNQRLQKFTSAGAYVTEWGVTNAFQLASDLFGNILVTDGTNYTIDRMVSPGPTVALVSDAGSDQGGLVSLRVLPSPYDAAGSGVTITGYEVYRRNDLLATATRASFASPAGVELAGWTYLGSFPANGEAEYNAVAPTLENASASNLYYSGFLVRAVTSNPLTYFDSPAENGYSIDNIPPGTPNPFTAAFVAPATHLHWGVSAATDFATFKLYRGSSVSFTPGPGNLIATTTDTGYVDVAVANWYKLSAVDFNGNESPYAVLGPAQTSAVPGDGAPAFALEGVRPNPASTRDVTVRFTLPIRGPASLELLDVSGRRVAVRDVGGLDAGAHAVNLAERSPVRPGLYFVRLTQGARERVARVTVLR